MAGKLSVTTSTSVEVKLAPRVRAQLRVKCVDYVRLSQEIATRKADQDKIKGDVEKMFVDADETEALMNGVDIDGYPVKMVCGSSTKLKPILLLQQGVTQEQIDEATVSTPSKPYIRIGKEK